MFEDILKEFELYMDERIGQLVMPERLKEAIYYSLFAKGKRMRPLLIFSVASFLQSQDIKKVYPFALALEMVHTYSLIHDDLPAMDNDDWRRGIPTNHKVFGEDVAILAGDGLLSQSFEILLDLEFSSEKVMKLFRVFAQGIGINGMVGGQIEDILLEKRNETNISLEYLQQIHQKKTGKLIEIAMYETAYLFDFSDEILRELKIIAQDMGILFQAVDDYLDATGTLESLGKTAGIDTINNKPTYISILGVGQTYEYIQKKYLETKKRVDILKTDLKCHTEMLEILLAYVVERNK